MADKQAQIQYFQQYYFSLQNQLQQFGFGQLMINANQEKEGYQTQSNAEQQFSHTEKMPEPSKAEVTDKTGD